ncbi:aspartic peptidase domain-containing protein [Suillus spraguei]|nr:aspartic peptidase domain-containing protein [Suillus spraguei]
MFSVASLLALLTFSITGSSVEVRNSPITLPMARRLTSSNVTDILRHDKARVAAFREYSTHGRRANIPLTNSNLAYTVTVNIGFPPISYHLIVDSFYSITWVGASATYVSSTGIDTKEPVALRYNYAFFEGTIFKDTLSFGRGLTIPEMLIGVASASYGIGFDGVLGIGPTVSSRGTSRNSPEYMIPSVTDYLLWQGTITIPVVGIFFQPIVRDETNFGELTLGGVNPGMYAGDIKFTDLTTTYPSSQHWGINQRITYGNTEIMPYTAGVVDCSCTLIYIASDAYERYQAATGGTENMQNGLLQISTDQYDTLDPLKFYIGSEVYSLVPNAQIWPRPLNHIMLGVDNDIFLVVQGLPSPSGTGSDFVNGYVFLKRFYTVFDLGSSRVGFAKTPFTDVVDAN